MRYFIYCRKSSEAEDRQILSIESQLTTLRRTFEGRPDVEMIDVYDEAFSAKAPGRSRFNEMLSRIEKGEADGLIAWAPDRLARNSIDGGRIVYLLDRGVLRDLKFATYTFENNSQGKFMLQIMFGQSKYYSDALSENVKRGNRTKLDRGWRPNQAPLGYLNDPTTKTIVKDPVHFPLIRRMYEMTLTGAYTPKQIALIARDEWGFRTPKKKRIGGSPLAMSSIYKILSNPFYAGIIEWAGQIFPGRHEPVVSLDEFKRVRRMVERPGRPRPQKHTFAYTGMIRCGSCGLMVTAEHKINRQGYRYLYYHCTNRRLGPRCTEPSIEVRLLELHIVNFLRKLEIGPAIEAWVLKEVARNADRSREEEQARKLSLEKSTEEIEAQFSELTSLRIRKLIADGEFLERRAELQQEQLRLQRKLAVDGSADSWFEPVGEVISFSNRATDWFVRGDATSKRVILESVGSNLTLKDKKLNIEAKKPFSTLANQPTCTRRLTIDDDVRKFHNGKNPWGKKLIKEVRDGLDEPECVGLIDAIRKLKERFEPVAPALKRAKSLRAKDARGGYRALGDDESFPPLPLS